MLAASVAAAVVGCGSLVSAAAPVFAADSSCNSVTVMKSGHIDAFHASASGSAVDLQMKWDNSPDKTKIFAPEKSVIDVPAKAWSSGVAQVIGHEAYMLPQVQEAGIPWVGWDMLGLGAGGYRKATIVLDEVAGPGSVRMFIERGFGAKPQPLAEGKNADDYVVRTGDRLADGPELTHKHFYWTFDDPGVYTIVAHVEAKGEPGTKSTRSRTYTFAVGGTTEQGCRVAKGLEKAGPATSPVPTPGSGGGDGTGSDGSGKSKDDKGGTEVPVFHRGEKATLSANDFDPAGGEVTFTLEKPSRWLASGKPDAKGAVSGLTGTIPEDVQLGDNAILVTQGKTSVRLPVRIVDKKTDGGSGEKTSTSSSTSSGAVTASSGGGQSAAVSSSASTTSSGEVCLPKKITRKISAAEARNYQGGGTSSGIAVFESGNLGQDIGNVWFARVGDTHQLPLHTHVHPNWVFPKPGTYKVTLSESVPLKSGQTVSGRTTLTFIVGGAGNANDGHFDLGAELHGNTLVPMLKDDRNSPPKWVNPESVTFGIGQAGLTTKEVPVPVASRFGISGRVYMIGSTQVAGVPWVGANTQNETLLSQAAGPVTWKLEAVQAPPGAAGNGGAGQLTKNADGSYTVTEVVGRTPSGKPCSLGSNLAKTGVGPMTPALAVFGLGLLVAGVGAVALRAQLRPVK